MNKLLKVPEVAERLRLSERTVRARIAEGDLPVIRLGTNPHAPVRIDELQLERWLYGPTKESA